MKMSINTIISDIQKNLSADLLKKEYRGSSHAMEGHCYVATETLYHILQSIPQYCGQYKPYVLSNKTWPLLKPGKTHWYLMSSDLDVLDVTASQFKIPFDEIPHWKGTPNGMMNHPKGGSKRSRMLRNRILINLKDSNSNIKCQVNPRVSGSNPFIPTFDYRY